MPLVLLNNLVKFDLSYAEQNSVDYFDIQPICSQCRHVATAQHEVVTQGAQHLIKTEFYLSPPYIILFQIACGILHKVRLSHEVRHIAFVQSAFGIMEWGMVFDVRRHDIYCREVRHINQC